MHRKLFEADPSQHRNLADGLRHHGIVLQKCGRPTQAVSAFQEGITVLEGLTSPRPVNVYDIACLQSLISGAADEAADGRAEADKAMESLRRAVTAGWTRADHMRIDTDLDPIRSRPDFQLLIMDLVWPVDPFARPD